jgi:hypothetical protein
MSAPILARDADPTGFTAALEALLEAVPGGLCATFLDAEGETIDLATRIDPYDARVYSAELALPLATLRGATRQLAMGPLRAVSLVGALRSAVLHRVADGCDVLLVVEGATPLARASYECARAARSLAVETGVPTRRAVSLRPEGATGEAPRAFLEDGRVRRVAAVLGAPDATLTEALLVRTLEGDECLIARDPATKRWFRL